MIVPPSVVITAAALFGVLVTLASPAPVRVVIAFTLGCTLAVILASVLILVTARLFAPVVTVGAILAGAAGRAGPVTVVTLALSWPVSVSVVVRAGADPRPRFTFGGWS